MDNGNCHNVDQLLKAIQTHKEADLEFVEDGFTLRVIGVKDPNLDYGHRYIMRAKDIENLFKYIKQLKKEIARLKKKNK